MEHLSRAHVAWANGEMQIDFGNHREGDGYLGMSAFRSTKQQENTEIRMTFSDEPLDL